MRSETQVSNPSHLPRTAPARAHWGVWSRAESVRAKTCWGRGVRQRMEGQRPWESAGRQREKVSRQGGKGVQGKAEWIVSSSWILERSQIWMHIRITPGPFQNPDAQATPQTNQNPWGPSPDTPFVFLKVPGGSSAQPG